MAISMEQWMQQKGQTPPSQIQPSQPQPIQSKTMDQWAADRGIAPQIKKPSIFQGIAQEVASPFLKIGRTAVGAYEAVKGLGKAAFAPEEQRAQILREAEQKATTPTDYGYFGSIAPAQTPKEAIGVGLEAGSWMAPVGIFGKAAQAAKGAMPLGKAMIGASKAGAVGTGLATAGMEAQKPESTAGSIFKSGAGGAALGAVTAPVFPLAGKAIGESVKLAGKGKNLASSGIKKADEFIRGPSYAPLGKTEAHPAVIQNFERAIRPSVSRKGTLTQRKSYIQKADDVVNTIVANKKDLDLTDDLGNVITPKSLNQFSQAIDSMKRKIFTAYNGLKKVSDINSTNAIDANTLAMRFEREAQPLLQMVNPDSKRAGQRMLKYAESLRKKGRLTLEQAQDEVQSLNAGALAQKATGQPHTAGADELLSKLLREELDRIIGLETGAEYQQLRNLYGAFRTIENDVNKRAVVEMRKSPAGFFDFSDVFSGADLVQAFARLDPTLLARGVAMRGFKNYLKSLNSPDRMIRSMFEGVEKTGSKSGMEFINRTNEQIKSAIGRQMTGEGRPKMLPPASFIPSVSTFKGRAAAAVGEPIYHRSEGKKSSFNLIDDNAGKKFVSNRFNRLNEIEAIKMRKQSNTLADMRLNKEMKKEVVQSRIEESGVEGLIRAMSSKSQMEKLLSSDVLRDGWLLQKGSKYIVKSGSDVEKYLLKGYKRIDTIDSIAMESYGGDVNALIDGVRSLKEQLDQLRLIPKQKEAHEFLLTNDDIYANIEKEITSLKEELGISSKEIGSAAQETKRIETEIPF